MPFTSDSAIWNRGVFLIRFNRLKFVLKSTGIVATDGGLKGYLKQLLI